MPTSLTPTVSSQSTYTPNLRRETEYSTTVIWNYHRSLSDTLTCNAQHFYYSRIPPCRRSPSLCQRVSTTFTSESLTVIRLLFVWLRNLHIAKLNHIPTVGYSFPLLTYLSAYKYHKSGRSILEEGQRKVRTHFSYAVLKAHQRPFSIRIKFGKSPHLMDGSSSQMGLSACMKWAKRQKISYQLERVSNL